VLLLVMLAAMAAAVLRLSVQSNTAMQQDLQATRAAAAARSGLDWALWQVLKGSWGTACASAVTSQTLDLRALTGVQVTVRCSALLYDEGESSAGVSQQRTFYTLESVACNGSAASCPDNTAATRSGYVERKSQATVVR
jgi:MSHA biogenesis protein MshP